MGASKLTISREDLRETLLIYEKRDIEALPGRTNHLPGAVLIPIELGEDCTCIVTVRPKALRLHSGEVVFPGGGPESQDGNLKETALRETREELGLSEIEVLGELSSIPLYTSDYRLHPFVGIVDDGDKIMPNSAEVESVHRLSLNDYLTRDFIHAIAVRIPEKPIHLSPVFEVADRLMFGGTAYAFYELLTIIAKRYERAAPPLKTGKYVLSDILSGASDENIYGGAQTK